MPPFAARTPPITTRVNSLNVYRGDGERGVYLADGSERHCRLKSADPLGLGRLYRVTPGREVMLRAGDPLEFALIAHNSTSASGSIQAVRLRRLSRAPGLARVQASG